MARILVVDDERDFRLSVAEALSIAGHDVQQAGTADEALGLLRRDGVDVILSDLRMPGRSGIELLKEASARHPEAILVVLTAYGSLDTAIEALRLGAHDYMLKPLRLEALQHKIGLLLRHRDTAAENRILRDAAGITAPSTGLAGDSPSMRETHRLLSRVAPTDSTVLILGETGTGKELVARAVHRQSPRREQPFVAVNCGAIPEALLESELFGHVRGAFTGADRDKRGLFEVAGNGTILLDEIGEMPLPLQPKVLRVLESREILRVGSTVPVRVGARIVAATHRNLSRMAEEGTFRPDLFYRLAVFEIAVAPLRERPEDIGVIAKSLLERFGRSMNRPVPTLGEGVLLSLQRHRWPGNVRELANVLERAMILNEGRTLELHDLPGFMETPESPAEDDLKAARTAFERAHIRRVLDRCAGDKRQAADLLGIDLSSLYRKLEETRKVF